MTTQRPKKPLRYKPSEPTAETKEFFKTKGLAFNDLWKKRMARGLLETESEKLEQMLGEYLKAKGEL